MKLQIMRGHSCPRPSQHQGLGQCPVDHRNQHITNLMSRRLFGMDVSRCLPSKESAIAPDVHGIAMDISKSPKLLHASMLRSGSSCFDASQWLV